MTSRNISSCHSSGQIEFEQRKAEICAHARGIKAIGKSDALVAKKEKKQNGSKLFNSAQLSSALPRGRTITKRNADQTLWLAAEAGAGIGQSGGANARYRTLGRISVPFDAEIGQFGESAQMGPEMASGWVDCDTVEDFYRCFADDLVRVEEAHAEVE